MDGERFPGAARLSRSEEIRHVFRSGFRTRRDGVEVFWTPSRVAPGRARVGVVVPRHGHTVAERNRLRRRLREIARRDWLPGALRAGDARDVVVRAGPSAYGRPFGALRADLLEALECSGG